MCRRLVCVQCDRQVNGSSHSKRFIIGIAQKIVYILRKYLIVAYVYFSHTFLFALFLLFRRSFSLFFLSLIVFQAISYIFYATAVELEFKWEIKCVQRFISHRNRVADAYWLVMTSMTAMEMNGWQNARVQTFSRCNACTTWCSLKRFTESAEVSSCNLLLVPSMFPLSLVSM